MIESLFMVGEIGGTDYNLPLVSTVPIEKIRSFTPSVIAKVSSTNTVNVYVILYVVVAAELTYYIDSYVTDWSLQELIRLGAKTLVVPGNLPTGCVPKYMLKF
jgi:hypothetical protein